MFRGRGGGGDLSGLIRALFKGIIAVLLLIVFLKLFMVLMWMTGGIVVLAALVWLAWRWLR